MAEVSNETKKTEAVIKKPNDVKKTDDATIKQVDKTATENVADDTTNKNTDNTNIKNADDTLKKQTDDTTQHQTIEKVENDTKTNQADETTLLSTEKAEDDATELKPNDVEYKVVDSVEECTNAGPETSQEDSDTGVQLIGECVLSTQHKPNHERDKEWFESIIITGYDTSVQQLKERSTKLAPFFRKLRTKRKKQEKIDTQNNKKARHDSFEAVVRYDTYENEEQLPLNALLTEDDPLMQEDFAKAEEEENHQLKDEEFENDQQTDLDGAVTDNPNPHGLKVGDIVYRELGGKSANTWRKQRWCQCVITGFKENNLVDVVSTYNMKKEVYSLSRLFPPNFVQKSTKAGDKEATGEMRKKLHPTNYLIKQKLVFPTDYTSLPENFNPPVFPSFFNQLSSKPTTSGKAANAKKPPPFPNPPMISDAVLRGDNDALSKLLMDWYMKGYKAGFHQSTQEGE